MRRFYRDRLASLRLPSFGEKPIVVGVEFAGRIVGDVEQALLGPCRDCPDNEKQGAPNGEPQPASELCPPQGGCGAADGQALAVRWGVGGDEPVCTHTLREPLDVGINVFDAAIAPLFEADESPVCRVKTKTCLSADGKPGAAGRCFDSKNIGHP